MVVVRGVSQYQDMDHPTELSNEDFPDPVSIGTDLTQYQKGTEISVRYHYHPPMGSFRGHKVCTKRNREITPRGTVSPSQ